MSLKKRIQAKQDFKKSLKLQQEQKTISEKKKGIPFFLFSSHKKLLFHDGYFLQFISFLVM